MKTRRIYRDNSDCKYEEWEKYYSKEIICNNKIIGCILRITSKWVDVAIDDNILNIKDIDIINSIITSEDKDGNREEVEVIYAEASTEGDEGTKRLIKSGETVNIKRLVPSGEVNANGLAFSEESFNKSIENYMEERMGAVCLDYHKDIDLMSFEGICIDPLDVIGKLEKVSYFDCDVKFDRDIVVTDEHRIRFEVFGNLDEELSKESDHKIYKVTHIIRAIIGTRN